VLRRGNDEVSLRDRGSHLRLSAVCLELRDRVRERAASLAAQAGITIEHIAKSYIRKEAVVAEVLKRRGEHPGLVHVISAMEACGAYQPWHDKQTHKTFVRPDSGKCLHYYFYFIDAELGLVYLRVPTWAPFRLQFYCNGHSWLARQLTAEGIGFTAADNVFIRIDDWQRAQDLADRLSPDRLHLVLDRYAAQCCPVLDVFRQELPAWSRRRSRSSLAGFVHLESLLHARRRTRRRKRSAFRALHRAHPRRRAGVRIPFPPPAKGEPDSQTLPFARNTYFLRYCFYGTTTTRINFV
jgi:hypothetical protein